MPWLDCQSHESALKSAATATGVQEDRLAAAIIAGEPDFSGTSRGDPVESFPLEILNRVGVEIEQVQLDGALLFHGTRLAETESVRRLGLQPLSQRIEAIWEMLGDLARPESDERDWLDFRKWLEAGGGDHDGWLYRLKTREALHHGPFTVLVRDTLLRPKESGLHDYLDCPEIVQDICRCHAAHFGPDLDLEARFKAATNPCIVTVRRTGIGAHAIGPAIWFIRAQLLGEALDLCNAGFPPRPIGPKDVVAIDVAGEVID
jgi:hypothetical protein